jgi:hypothetical protein
MEDDSGRGREPWSGHLWRSSQGAEYLLSQSDPWREQIRRYLQTAQARLDELKSQPKAKDPQTAKLEAMRLELVQQRADQVREISSFFEMMLSHALEQCALKAASF